MSLTGATDSHVWSKRRAMFWGLLVASNYQDAYLAGERIAARLGRPPNAAWSSPRAIPRGFFRKAAIAELFDVSADGNSYRLTEKLGDPWAELIRSLAT